MSCVELHAHYGPSNPAPDTSRGKRGAGHYVSMVGLVLEQEDEYRKLHAEVWADVQAAIKAARITNYRIFVTPSLDGRKYLISSFDYVGDDLDKDVATIAQDPTTSEKWWPLTDACQFRLDSAKPGEQWTPLEQLMFLP